MKKLLSLLSVLTISGTAVPTTIAASPYQKDTSSTCGYNVKDKKQTINNLEKLNRNKRGAGAVLGTVGTVVGLADSYKSGGVVKDAVNYVNANYHSRIAQTNKVTPWVFR